MMTHRLRVRGIWLHVSDQGLVRTQPTQPSVVALHGGPGVDGSGLRYVLAALASECRLVIPDQRGHGLSDRATSRTWELDDWADDLAVMINQLELLRPTIFGISFGGWVALRLAARHPDRVGSVVLASQTARLPDIDEGAARMEQLGGAASGTAWIDLHNGKDATAYHEHCLPLMAVRRPDPTLTKIRKSQIRSPEVNAHFTPKFNSTDMTPDVATITCPLTVVVGEHDPFTTAELAHATAAAAKGLKRVRVVKDAAHDLLTDAPQVLLAEIRTSILLRAR